MNPPVVLRRRRFARQVWRSPLARSVDRAEAAVTWALLATWVLALPILILVGTWQWHTLTERSVDRAAAVVAVDAVLTGDPAIDPIAERSVVAGADAPAFWSAPSGTVVHGLVDVPPGAKTGDSVRVWVDSTGQVTMPPITTSDLAVESVLITTGGWIGLGLALLGVWWLVRRSLDRRRGLAWAQEWAEVGPTIR